jgi:hypothetical protein
MPRKISKFSQRDRREVLQAAIEADGIDMPTPCARCKHLSLSCRIDLRSGRCSGCTRLGKKCDLLVTKVEFERLRKQKLRLKDRLKQAIKEQEDAASVARDAAEKAQTLQSKVKRLFLQLQLAEDREGEAFDRELSSIEEAERVEESLSLVEATNFNDPIPASSVTFNNRLVISPS